MPYKNIEDQKQWARDNVEKLKLYSREYRKQNIEHLEAQGRLNHVKLKYNLSAEEYFELLQAQDNKCAICDGYEITKNTRGDIRPLCIDHCHNTGKVRALLCNKCNRAIGLFNDDADLTQKAVDYLNTFKER